MSCEEHIANTSKNRAATSARILELAYNSSLHPTPRRILCQAFMMQSYDIFLMDRNKIIKKIFNIALPFILSGAILWWMYRYTDFKEIEHTVMHEMNWGWMLFSLVFGVTAQLFRGIRWKQTLAPMNEHPRTSDCIHAVFISYASSLIIPRSGELVRCGILSRYDRTPFLKSFGTVVTERIIDSMLILTITVVVILSQLPVFLSFFDKTGTSIDRFLYGFTSTGYIVTAICIIFTIIFLWYMAHRLAFMTKLKEIIDNVREGMTSLRHVNSKWLFAFYTIAIWLSYFLHYWITFKCFGFTEHLSFTAAIVSFIVGSISVIVPTPNGAGAWHLAVKTILVLYGVASTDAVVFALIVHTIQTALVPILGIYSIFVLSMRKTTATSNWKDFIRS